VIALGRGGVRETILTDGPAPTGLFFDQPTPAAIAAAIRAFLVREPQFSAAACHANALRFSEERFESEFSAFVNRQFANFQAQLVVGHAQPERLRSAAFAAVK